MSVHWTQQNRDLLDGVLDHLIPANPEKGIPSAGVFGVGKFIAARAVEDDNISSALNDLLGAVSSIDGTISVEMVRQLEVNCPKPFSLLVRLTYMGYYSRPEIRTLIGLASRPVHPIGYEVPIESADMLDLLTAPVKERGQAYREFEDEKVQSSNE